MDASERGKSLPDCSDKGRAFLYNLYRVHKTGSVLVLVAGGMICQTHEGKAGGYDITCVDEGATIELFMRALVALIDK